MHVQDLARGWAWGPAVLLESSFQGLAAEWGRELACWLKSGFTLPTLPVVSLCLGFPSVNWGEEGDHWLQVVLRLE